MKTDICVGDVVVCVRKPRRWEMYSGMKQIPEVGNLYRVIAMEPHPRNPKVIGLSFYPGHFWTVAYFRKVKPADKKAWQEIMKKHAPKKVRELEDA